MKKKFNFKAYIASTITILVSSIVVSLFGLSFAAYLNVEKENQTININMDYSEYFNKDKSDSGNKTYVITTGEHLRNLSKLVAIGAFTPDFTFVLGDDIDYSSEKEPLIPIGSDNTPFYSIFDGQGHTITNLNVVGSDLADVGMFGYVANGATIKNFLLDTPFVSAKGTYLNTEYTTDAFAIRDRNPFRTKYGTALDTLAKSVTLTPTVPEGQKNDVTKEFSTFTISYTADKSIPFTVKTYVNKEGFVTSSDGFNFTRDGSYASASSYFTVEVYVEGLVEINEEYFYSRYTLERFKIYYKTTEIKDGYSPVGFIQNPDDPKCYRKTIEVPPNHILSGTNTYDYYNQHVVYAGIVCGHLDGQAEYIGVKSGTLYADNRAFRSNSVLIGKRIDDDDYSTLSKEYLNVDKAGIINDDLGWVGISSGADSSTNNRYASNLYQDGNNNNFSSIGENYVRLYGSQRQNNNNGGVRIENQNIKDGEEVKSTKIISFYESIDCFHKGNSVRGNANMFKSNCFSMWVTSEFSSGFNNVINELLGKSGDFYLKFKFNYILFDSSKSSSTTNELSDLKIKLYGSTKRKTQGTIFGAVISNYYSSGTSDVHPYGEGYYYSKGINEGALPNNDDSKVSFGYVDTSGGYYNSLQFNLEEAVPYPLGEYQINKTDIHEKEIVIASNPDSFKWDTLNKRTPIVCFGFDIPTDADGNPTAIISIVDFTVTLSTVKGNYASDPLTIDYYTDSYKFSPETGEWADWPKYSNTKVGINCFSSYVSRDSYNTETDKYSPEEYPYMSASPYVPSTYKITMTRKNDGVNVEGNITCTYSMGTSSENHIPQNTEGYVKAKIVSSV